MLSNTNRTALVLAARIGALAGLLAVAPAATDGVLAQPADSPRTKRLTIDRLYSLPHLIGNRPTGYAWSPDSRHLAFLWNDAGGNFRDVWVVDAASAEPAPRRVTQTPRLEVELLEGADPLEVARARERVERDPGVTGVHWHPDGRRLLLEFRGDLWLVEAGAPGGASNPPSNPPRRLTETEEAESRPAYSPDGTRLAYLREGDVWTIPASADGTDAPADPVRQTGISRPDVRVGFQWSPDGRRLAVFESDASGVPERSIPDYLAPEPVLVRLRRAYPGDEPVRHRLGWLDVRLTPEEAPAADLPTVHWLDLTAGTGTAPDMILDYAWSPDGRHLAVDTSDLYAKDRRVLVAEIDPDAPDKPAFTVARDRDDENETFYFWRIAWSTDSRLVYFLSDRKDDYHVWAVAPEVGATARQLTGGADGTWAVAEMHPVPGGLVVVGNRGHAEERQLFQVSDTGGEPIRLSERAGTHEPTISPDGRHAAVAFSSDTTPPELLLTRMDGAEPSERRVTHSAINEFDDYRWARPSYVTFPSHVDGTPLHGRLTLPPDFDPERRYPAILGSVYTESVRNQWGGRTAHPTWGLDQFLAQEGFVLLNVDMRGSWGRGREHRRGIRLDYGGMDIEDLESGVRFLGTLDYVDTGRVGIWGSSYGGLMTAMSLFRKPGLYAAGVAGAPATNVWHALTGQMAVMMHPDDQPDEYADSSPFMHAHGLEDPLMIIHGMRDWVVLFKDSVTLVQRLIQLDKDVDFVVLPDAGHGWDNEGLAQTRFAFKKLVEHFREHLGSPSDGPQ